MTAVGSGGTGAGLLISRLQVRILRGSLGEIPLYEMLLANLR
jgi:hypothetical protein